MFVQLIGVPWPSSLCEWVGVGLLMKIDAITMLLMKWKYKETKTTRLLNLRTFIFYTSFEVSWACILVGYKIHRIIYIYIYILCSIHVNKFALLTINKSGMRFNSANPNHLSVLTMFSIKCVILFMLRKAISVLTWPNGEKKLNYLQQGVVHHWK